MTPLEQRARELCVADGRDPNFAIYPWPIWKAPHGKRCYPLWENYTDKVKKEIDDENM